MLKAEIYSGDFIWGRYTDTNASSRTEWHHHLLIPEERPKGWSLNMEGLRIGKPKPSDLGGSPRVRSFLLQRQTRRCRPCLWSSWELGKGSEKQLVHSSPSYHKTHPNTVIKPLRALPQQGEMCRVKYCHPWYPYQTIPPCKMQRAGTLNHRSEGCVSL